MQSIDWRSFSFYRPGDFNHPDRLDPSVVIGLENMTRHLGVKVKVIDDYGFRSDNPNSQHPKGRAVDFTADLPVTTVLDSIKAAGFTGYGVYQNAAGVVSYHVDTRTDRTPEDPAAWGGQKFTTSDAGWSYTGLQTVLDHIKSGVPALVWAILLLIASYWLAKTGRD